MGHPATTVDPTGNLVRGALYGGGMHLADYTAGTGAGGGKTEFHLSDEVNSLVNTIDQTGAMLESCAAGAFGEALNCSPSADYTENHFADTKRDQESSLDAMGARYYSSTIGRFTSLNPSGIAYADLSNPQTLNSYTYVANNPLIFTDPSGLAIQYNCSPAAPDQSTVTKNGLNVSGNLEGCTSYDDGQGNYEGLIAQAHLTQFRLLPMAPSKGPPTRVNVLLKL